MNEGILRVCSACKTDVAEGVRPCPNCGNDTFTFCVTLTARVGWSAHYMVKAKLPRGGSIKQGDNFFKSRSVWHQIYQHVDKIKRTYTKRVWDEQGNLIRDSHGPLPDQSLHGPTHQAKANTRQKGT